MHLRNLARLSLEGGTRGTVEFENTTVREKVSAINLMLPRLNVHLGRTVQYASAAAATPRNVCNQLIHQILLWLLTRVRSVFPTPETRLTVLIECVNTVLTSWLLRGMVPFH